MTRHPPGGVRDAAAERERPIEDLRVDASPSFGVAGARTDRRELGATDRASDHDPVLEEIDRIWRELNGDGEPGVPWPPLGVDVPNPAAPTSPDAAPPPPPGAEPWAAAPEPPDVGVRPNRPDSPGPPPGTPSGYFEAQLGEARRSAAGMEGDLAEIESTLMRLRGGLATVRADLTHLDQEHGYLRSRISAEGNTADRSVPTPSLPVRDGPARAEVPAPLGMPPPYHAFTVARYNRTMNEFKGRRAGLATLTLLLSAGIAALLVTLVLYAPATDPPIWVAALPLVWVVPIPFFLLAFRGTHRVLQRNHLNLPEAE